MGRLPGTTAAGPQGASRCESRDVQCPAASPLGASLLEGPTKVIKSSSSEQAEGRGPARGPDEERGPSQGLDPPEGRRGCRPAHVGSSQRHAAQTYRGKVCVQAAEGNCGEGGRVDGGFGMPQTRALRRALVPAVACGPGERGPAPATALGLLPPPPRARCGFCSRGVSGGGSSHPRPLFLLDFPGKESAARRVAWPPSGGPVQTRREAGPFPGGADGTLPSSSDGIC